MKLNTAIKNTNAFKEDKRKQDFIKRAEYRMTRAITKLDLLKDLATSKRCSYDDVQVKKIITTLESKVKEIKKAYDKGLFDKENIPFDFK